MPGLRFWPRGLQGFLAGLWGASSCNSCSSASSSCQIREACDVETCVSTWRTQRATPLAIPRGSGCVPAQPRAQPAARLPMQHQHRRARPEAMLFGSAGARSRVFTGPRGAELDPGGTDALALVGPSGEGAGSGQSEPSVCDPNWIFQPTANPEAAGAAGAGGAVTAQPVTALLGWVGMLRQPIVAQLPGGLSAGSQSQPGPSQRAGDHAE